MKRKEKVVFVALTDEQIKQLEPVFKQAESAKQYGMILAQLSVMNDGKGLMMCGFVEHSKAIEIQRVMSPNSVGETTDKRNWRKIRQAAGI